MTWFPPDNETDFYYARLPFYEAQLKFSETAPDGTTHRAEAGWHGTRLDAERGSFCIVQRGGILSDLVGERLRITRTDRLTSEVIVCFCHRRADIIEDISLTRRGYLALTDAWDTVLDVKIEVLS